LQARGGNCHSAGMSKPIRVVIVEAQELMVAGLELWVAS
jgi:hypothetical protein